MQQSFIKEFIKDTKDIFDMADTNICNAYLFQRIDDIVDRIPNTKLEENYGSLTPPRIDQPSDFWRTVLGDDWAQDIDVIAIHNHSDRETTIKTLNLFGLFFKDIQETAKAILQEQDHNKQSALRQDLMASNRFTSWVAAQLCLDIVKISGDENIDKKFRLDVFSDCAKTSSESDLKRLADDYKQIHADYHPALSRSTFDQIDNDIDDTVKDLGIYRNLYPDHVPTNIVLSKFLIDNPGADLISVDHNDMDIMDKKHPLCAAFTETCDQYSITPSKITLKKFDKERELPPFQSLSDSTPWQWIKAPTLLANNAMKRLPFWRHDKKPAPENTLPLKN
jgi:hypothetical protein